MGSFALLPTASKLKPKSRLDDIKDPPPHSLGQYWGEVGGERFFLSGAEVLLHKTRDLLLNYQN
jgi:hypothetical protein